MRVPTSFALHCSDSYFVQSIRIVTLLLLTACLESVARVAAEIQQCDTKHIGSPTAIFCQSLPLTMAPIKRMSGSSSFHLKRGEFVIARGAGLTLHCRRCEE